MKHVTVVITLRSRLMALGMRTALTETSLTNVSYHIIEPGMFAENVERLRPQVVIADPFTALSYGDFRSMLSDNAVLIGVTALALPSEVAKCFDLVMTAYDSTEAVERAIVKVASEPSDDDKANEQLTPREREVLIGVVRGRANKEIAADMNVSVNTVMTHRCNIASKLQIHSVAGLTIYAIVSKLVSIDEIRPGIS